MNAGRKGQQAGLTQAQRDNVREPWKLVNIRTAKLQVLQW